MDYKVWSKEFDPEMRQGGKLKREWSSILFSKSNVFLNLSNVPWNRTYTFISILQNNAGRTSGTWSFFPLKVVFLSINRFQFFSSFYFFFKGCLYIPICTICKKFILMLKRKDSLLWSMWMYSSVWHSESPKGKKKSNKSK